jgi:hypothetical protein
VAATDGVFGDFAALELMTFGVGGFGRLIFGAVDFGVGAAIVFPGVEDNASDDDAFGVCPLGVLGFTDEPRTRGDLDFGVLFFATE